jgi:hypothetical protein
MAPPSLVDIRHCKQAAASMFRLQYMYHEERSWRVLSSQGTFILQRPRSGVTYKEVDSYWKLDLFSFATRTNYNHFFNSSAVEAALSIELELLQELELLNSLVLLPNSNSIALFSLS